MTREERLAKLSTIRIIVANPVSTYDMGMQFDILTGEGAYTDLGNTGQWPYMQFKITDEIRQLRQSLLKGEYLSEDDLLRTYMCKELCIYHDLYFGFSKLEDTIRSKVLEQIKDGLKSVSLDGDMLYVYAVVQDWNQEIRIYDSYDAFCDSVIEDWAGYISPYTDMTDEEIKHWYDVAEENDWEGIPCAEYSEDKGE